MAYVKKQPLSGIREGDRVEDIFVVKIKRGLSPYSKGHSFHLILTDSSGKTIDYKFWGGQDEAKVKEVYDSIKPDSVVYVQGKASTYKDALQISANETDAIKTLASHEYDAAEFIPPAIRDVEEMYGELTVHINAVKNPELKAILDAVFSDKDRAALFKVHPGSIEIHHNRVGGLLEHTLQVVEYCLLSKKLFPQLDEDMIITGAILHDIGKLEEIQATSRIKGTTRGQLLGHVSMGFSVLLRITDELGTSEETKNKLLHILISHHGKMEHGAPKEPMTPEAVAVHYADAASCMIEEILGYRQWAIEKTDDEFMYSNRRQRNIYLK
ncbi:Dihydroneopterin 2',3'-cyclic phosphate phosphodiesterase [uncultured archaeon]|nr:Dihydroneopterin 2',3'-cyclic phosphate phosphodiesterase [uncultured archaeon]